MTSTSPNRLAVFSIAIGLLFATAGCPPDQNDVAPDEEFFLFPTAMALTPDESVLFVTSGNSELRKDAGTIALVELDRIESLIADWQSSTGATLPDERCRIDTVLKGVLQCDAAAAIRAGAGARVGNFSTSIGIQELASGDLRLFVAVRGDPSITWMDYSQATGQLSCNDESGEVFPLCDSRHRLLNLLDDVDQPSLLSEPYGMFVDSSNGYVVVTHQSLGAVTLLDAPPETCDAEGEPGCPLLSDTVTGLFEYDRDNGQAALGIAGRRPGTSSDLIYVTSRSEDRVVMLSVYDNGRTRVLAEAERFFLQGVAASNDSRGLAFNSDGTRLHIVNRDPAVLHIYDTSDGPDGFPRNQFVGGVELCNDASNIQVANLGRGDRAYISCFPKGQIWVIDPQTETLAGIIDVGRGPHAMALAERRGRLYVANFLEDTIAVVDITPGSATENRVLMRLDGHDPQGDQ